MPDLRRWKWVDPCGSLPSQSNPIDKFPDALETRIQLCGVPHISARHYRQDQPFIPHISTPGEFYHAEGMLPVTWSCLCDCLPVDLF